jgi:hypothetical protein
MRNYLNTKQQVKSQLSATDLIKLIKQIIKKYEKN